MCFAVFPLSGIYVSRLGRRLRRISGNTQAELAIFSTFLNQVFQSMRHVKAYGMERFEAGRAEVRITQLYNLAHKVFRVSSLSQPVSEILSGFATLGLILYGGHEVFKGHLTPGGLFTFIGAFFFAYEPLKRAAKLNGVLQTGLGGSRARLQPDRSAPDADRCPCGPAAGLGQGSHSPGKRRVFL